MIIALAGKRRVGVGLGCPGEQSADPARAFKAAAEVFASRVGCRGQVVDVALLDDEVAVVHVINLVGLHPAAALPRKLLADSPAHLAVIRELRLPLVRHPNLDQLVLVVVGETAQAVVGQVAVAVVLNPVCWWRCSRSRCWWRSGP